MKTKSLSAVEIASTCWSLMFNYDRKAHPAKTTQSIDKQQITSSSAGHTGIIQTHRLQPAKCGSNPLPTHPSPLHSGPRPFIQPAFLLNKEIAWNTQVPLRSQPLSDASSYSLLPTWGDSRIRWTSILFQVVDITFPKELWSAQEMFKAVPRALWTPSVYSVELFI